MNIEQLMALARAVMDEIRDSEIRANLDVLASGLEGMATQPGATQFQEQVKAVRARIATNALESALAEWPQNWRSQLIEMGVADMLGASVADEIDGILTRDEMTPAAAASEVRDWLASIETLNEQLTRLTIALEYLEFTPSGLPVGAAEVQVSIPRRAVAQQLGQLGDEFKSLSRLILPFEELVTGNRTPLRVRAIASSDYQVLLDVVPKVALMVAVSLERLLNGYKTVLEIRRLRQELRDKGNVPESSLEAVDSHANSVMKEVIDDYVTEIAADEALTNIDSGRRNELRIELRVALSGIADRIDKGFDFDVTAREPSPKTDSKNEAGLPKLTKEEIKTLRQILETSRSLKLPKRDASSILSLAQSRGDDEASIGTNDEG